MQKAGVVSEDFDTESAFGASGAIYVPLHHWNYTWTARTGNLKFSGPGVTTSGGLGTNNLAINGEKAKLDYGSSYHIEIYARNM